MRRPELVVSIGKAREAGSPYIRDAVLLHLDALYRFALRLSGSADHAKELTQDAVLRALERQNTVVRDPRAWLCQTLYHTFVDHYRKSVREQTGLYEVSALGVTGDEAEWEGTVNPLPAFIANEDVRKAIERLPGEFRAVVWLSDAEEFQLQEIAEILECPLGTVASRLARGCRELRRLLAAYGREQEK